jgi:hypothetical protein
MVIGVNSFDCDAKNSMRPAGGVVEVVGRHHFVLDAGVEEVHDLFRGPALENVQVFYCELFFLGVPDSEAFLSGETFLAGGHVEKIEHSFVINLEEGAEN